MKRDIDLVRKLVFAIEEHPHGFAPENLIVDGYSDEQIGYHLTIMVEAGFINGSDETHLLTSALKIKVDRPPCVGHFLAGANP